MVDDKANKDLPASTGDVPPDALFKYVHNDVAYRITYAELAAQIDGA